MNQKQLEKLLLDRKIVSVYAGRNVELVLDNGERVYIECGTAGVNPEYDGQPVLIRSLGKKRVPKSRKKKEALVWPFMK